MNNTDWKILIYLKEERSINKVAKRLFMTQPSLTYRLSQMEKEIGVPLFIRTNKGVHFTDAGDRLYSFAEKELQQYQDMKSYVTHDPNDVSGVLRIGASQSFTQSHMPYILKGFADRYHDIDISLTNDTSDHLIKLIKKEEIQIAIIRGTQDWYDYNITLEKQPLYLISATPIDENLPKQPSIRYLTDPSLDELRVRWWKQNFTEPPQFILAVNDCLTSIEIINAGLGHAIVTGDILPKCQPQVYRQVIYDNKHHPITRSSHLICKSAMLASNTVSVFIDFIKEYFHITEEQEHTMELES
jgi:DNA-binding transcriptional LysR family regulator